MFLQRELALQTLPCFLSFLLIFSPKHVYRNAGHIQYKSVFSSGCATDMLLDSNNDSIKRMHTSKAKKLLLINDREKINDVELLCLTRYENKDYAKPSQII